MVYPVAGGIYHQDGVKAADPDESQTVALFFMAAICRRPSIRRWGSFQEKPPAFKIITDMQNKVPYWQCFILQDAQAEETVSTVNRALAIIAAAVQSTVP